MAGSGTAALNFGAFPGVTDIAQDVSAPGVISTSLVEAWIQPVATADHSADEHRVENLKVSAVWKVDGTITIVGIADDPPINGMAPGTLYGVYNVGWVWV